MKRKWSQADVNDEINLFRLTHHLFMLKKLDEKQNYVRFFCAHENWKIFPWTFFSCRCRHT